MDAQLIAQLKLGVIDELPCPIDADANKDGVVDISDAQLIAQFLLGRIDSLPPTQSSAFHLDLRALLGLASGLLLLGLWRSRRQT